MRRGFRIAYAIALACAAIELAAYPVYMSPASVRWCSVRCATRSEIPIPTRSSRELGQVSIGMFGTAKPAN
jgi:hypothetical protein